MADTLVFPLQVGGAHQIRPLQKSFIQFLQFLVFRKHLVFEQLTRFAVWIKFELRASELDLLLICIEYKIGEDGVIQIRIDDHVGMFTPS